VVLLSGEVEQRTHQHVSCKGNLVIVLVGDSEREATVHLPTIEEDGTSTALPLVAIPLGASESATFAQHVQGRRPGINEKPMRWPVHPNPTAALPDTDLAAHLEGLRFNVVARSSRSLSRKGLRKCCCRTSYFPIMGRRTVNVLPAPS
jgi:hypothetical protein